MGKQTVYRVTGFFLSLVILLLGCGSTVLLYYAGQSGIDFVFTSQNLYKDAENVIRVRNPTESWYGEFMLRGWIAGFIYMLPGATGIIASLFYYKCPMIVHFILSIFLVFVGSFVHTAGGMAILMYRLFVINGAVRHNVWLGDCIYIRDAAIPLEYVDEQCLEGRKALMLTIAAISLMCLTWIFIFSDVLYRAFTYSNIKKTGRKTAEPSSETQRKLPRHRVRNHTREQTDLDISSPVQQTQASPQEDATIRIQRPIMPGPSNLRRDIAHVDESAAFENPSFETNGDEDDRNTEPSNMPTSMKKRAPMPPSSQQVTGLQHIHLEQDHFVGTGTQEQQDDQGNNFQTFGMVQTERQ